MPNRITRYLPFLALLAVLAWARPAAAQFGGIRGQAIDAHGKPLVGATVVFHQSEMNTIRKVKTDKKGDFADYGLPLGTYSVELVSPEGKSLFTVNHVSVGPGTPARVNFNLQKLAKQNIQHLTPQQLAAYKKALAHNLKVKAYNAKVQQLNQLLKQNAVYAKAGQWPQAIQTLQQAIAMDQTHALIYANLGNDYTSAGDALLEAKQSDQAKADYAQAATAYQKAISLLSAKPKPQNDAIAAYYINLGNAEAHQGLSQQAMASFAKGIQLDPAQAKIAYLNEAVIFFNSGQSDAAAAAAAKAISVDPNNPKAWYIKGMALMNKVSIDPKTNMPTAVPGTRAAFKKVLQLAPDSAYAQQAKINLQMLNTKQQTSYSH